MTGPASPERQLEWAQKAFRANQAQYAREMVAMKKQVEQERRLSDAWRKELTDMKRALFGRTKPKSYAAFIKRLTAERYFELVELAWPYGEDA